MRKLPPSWTATTIGEVVQVNPRPSANADDDDLVSFVPMPAVEAGTGMLDPSEGRPFGELKTKSYRRFEEGDVVVAKITPSMENGKAALARGLIGGQAFGTTELHVLRPSAQVDPRYLLHYVLRRSFRADAARHMTGTAGQLRVPAAYLRDARLPLPPIAEQLRIVEAIEEQFSRLDAGVESLERARRNLARMRASVLQAAVEGRLVAQDPDDEPARCALSRVLTQRSKQPPERDGDLPVAPVAGWEVTGLGRLMEHLRYGTSTRCDYAAEGEPVLRIPNVRGRTIDSGDLKRAVDSSVSLDRVRVSAGDLLFIRTNGSPDLIGRVAVVPAAFDGYAFASYLIRGRPLQGVSSAFLALVLESPFYRILLRSVAATSAGQYNVSASTLDGVPMPFPPLAEQQRIISEVERQFSILDAMGHTIESGLKRAGGLRQAILREAFAGRLVPQDPSDEPAPALLERIRAERVKA